MSLDLSPFRDDWPSIVRGDTFPAIVYAETSADVDLSRVRVKICDSDGVVQVTLDSATSGVTINTSTAGAWNFTVGPIAAATTENLTSGDYAYDIETTDASGGVRTEVNGIWPIKAQITDS